MASTALPLVVAAAAILRSARCLASDTISVDSTVSGRRTIVSRGGNFELGFFRPAGDNNHHYYVGIWYKKDVSQCTPVWVANRDAPVSDPASSQLAVALGMATGNSPSGNASLSPFPRGGKFPVPVPNNVHGEAFPTISVPARGIIPVGILAPL
ncbi:unnamed protein product [Urochloa humidicola]